MIRQRHPEVAAQLVDQLEGFPDTPVLQAASTAARSLHGVMGFEPPSWHALAAGVRPEPQPEEFQIKSQGGWQHEAASRIERRFRDVDLFSRLDDPTIAMLRSQGGPGAGLAVSTCPTCRVTRMEPQLFRVLILHRLQLPLPLTVRNCRCGLPLDQRGHHRAGCARAGVLGKRGYSLVRPHHGTPEEGTKVPRTGGARCPREAGRCWPGSGRKMVSGDTDLPQAAGTREGPFRRVSDEMASRTRMAFAMGLSFVVHCSPCRCAFAVGVAWGSWC